MAANHLLCFLIFSAGIHVISSATDPRDVVALRALKDSWQNTPPSWEKSDDPCGAPWEGVTCINSRVTSLELSSKGLVGELTNDIGGLTELRTLDLSLNTGLKGPIPPQLGGLKKLHMLLLSGCSFTGSIPSELGNLVELSFLDVSSNSLTGEIPPSLGNISGLYLLDLSDNQMTGSLPVSNPITPGLDLLKNAKHFHLYDNQFSGTIPAALFSADMTLIHLFLDGNQLVGRIPSSIGLVQTLQMIRLNGNALTGTVPANLRNLTNVNFLSLAQNKLTGPLPDLSGMNSLNYVDLSNNPFDQSEAPNWFTSLQSLITLILKNNAFNGTLDMGINITKRLQLVDLQNNQISSLVLGYNNTLMLSGNPICTVEPNAKYCKNQSK
ncbi:hypothetical protein RJ639_001192 [Escallonia herrerae]|uniref:Leucine-rich repeat-containing N-terminal plant-type domain-containing protein n=1 Tax=Escallonia herrerae TaxID=1293975 RepID=A0AA88XAP3_9ASTE|nr:hypothetical protein RJ639_001192 [Escallonia herrerae]